MRPTNHAVHEDYLLHSFKHAARSPGPAACPKNISLLARAQQVNALHASTPCPACKVAAQLPSRLPQSSHQISTLSLYLREPAGKEGSNTEGRMGVGECKSNDYGAAAYWDARYSSGSPASAAAGCGFFDWYQTYPALRPLLRARVPTSSRVLMLGCGNSRTSPFSTHELLLFAYCKPVATTFAMLHGGARVCSLVLQICSSPHGSRNIRLLLRFKVAIVVVDMRTF